MSRNLCIDRDVKLPLYVTVTINKGGAEPGSVFGGFDGFRQKLQDFFGASIRLCVGTPVGTAVLLAMLDVLELVHPCPAGDTRVDFGDYNPPLANYPAEVNAYFARLGLTRETAHAAPRGGEFPGWRLLSAAMPEDHREPAGCRSGARRRHRKRWSHGSTPHRWPGRTH
jgi:hypothetical protein